MRCSIIYAALPWSSNFQCFNIFPLFSIYIANTSFILVGVEDVEEREGMREKVAGVWRDGDIQQVHALFEFASTAPLAFNWLPVAFMQLMSYSC